MSSNYDIQQVCENGHQITSCYHTRPEERNPFCQKCGSPTLTSCQNCGEEIRGTETKYSERKTLESIVGVPLYCTNCSAPYPWTQKKIQTAIQILMEFGNLSDEEEKTVGKDIENIAKDLPEAELSARRIKRIWEKCSKAGYDVIMELASRTAAQILKGQYP